jgi:hypothetical protein
MNIYFNVYTFGYIQGKVTKANVTKAFVYQ